MAVLSDTSDEYVSSVLDRVKLDGAISLADLEAITEAGMEGQASIQVERCEHWPRWASRSRTI